MPQNIKSLTLAEIMSYVEEIEDGPEASNQRFAGDTEGYVKWVRSLTPEQLLEEAIAGTL